MHWIIGWCFHVTANLGCFQDLLRIAGQKFLIVVNWCVSGIIERQNSNSRLLKYLSTQPFLTLKIIVFAIVLTAVALSGAVSVASAETVPSPLQQVRDGVMASEIVCSDDRVLMVSQIGMPACVYATSTSDFLQRGFTMGSVQDVPTVISNELPVRHTYESDIKLGGHASSGGSGYSPVPYTIGLPDSFTIGETVSIPYSLSWQYENGTTKYERLGLPTPDVYKGQLGMLISDEFTVLDDNAVTVQGYEDRYSPHTGAMIYITTTSSEMTYNGTLNLRLDTAMHHDRDTILFLMYSDVYHFQVQRTDTGVNLVDTILLTDPYDLEQVRSSYYPPYMNDPSERYSVFYRPVNGTFTHVPEEQPSNTEPRAPEPPQENLYIPKHGWPDFAEFLRSEIEYRGITDVRDWMIENNLSEEFVTDFLTQYPEFTVTGADEPYWLSSDFAPLYMQDGAGSSAKKYVSLYAGLDPLANITKADIMPFWSRDDSFPYVQVKIPKSAPMTDTMTVTVNYDFTPRYGAEFNPDNIVQDAAFGAFTDEKVPYMGAVFLIQHQPQIRMISDYPTIPYDNDEYDCSGISWIILSYNGNVQHRAEISFVATAPISRMEDVFRISPEYSGVIDRSQWYISTDEDAITVTPFPRSSADFDVRSESGINIHFDKNYYTWTDRVYITITAPEHNLDSETVDSIGGNSTGTGMITISTGAAGIEGYELTETGEDTGVFAGHVTLTGFQFEGMHHEHKHQISSRTGGTGPTGGLVATSAMPDQITVSFLSLGGENVTKSVPIRWNAGTVQWFDKYYEGRYPMHYATLFWIRLADPDMNWNPDSADTFSVDMFSNTLVQSAERYATETSDSRIQNRSTQYVTETGNSTGIFEGSVFTTTHGGNLGQRLRIALTEDTLYTMYRDSTVSQDMCNSVYLEHAFTINKRMPVGDFTYPLFSPPELPVDLYFR